MAVGGNFANARVVRLQDIQDPVGAERDAGGLGKCGCGGWAVSRSRVAGPGERDRGTVGGGRCAADAARAGVNRAGEHGRGEDHVEAVGARGDGDITRRVSRGGAHAVGARAGEQR